MANSVYANAGFGVAVGAMGSPGWMFSFGAITFDRISSLTLSRTAIGG